MRALSTTLYQTMAAHGPLTALLGTFGGQPSIFAKRPVPDGAGMPLVLTTATVSDLDQDFINSEQREIQRDIAVYGQIPAHHNAVVDAAEIIRNLFHRSRFTVGGWRTVDVRARGPMDAPADPGEIGRIITLVIRLHEI